MVSRRWSKVQSPLLPWPSRSAAFEISVPPSRRAASVLLTVALAPCSTRSIRSVGVVVAPGFSTASGIVVVEATSAATGVASLGNGGKGVPSSCAVTIIRFDDDSLILPPVEMPQLQECPLFFRRQADLSLRDGPVLGIHNGSGDAGAGLHCELERDVPFI